MIEGAVERWRPQLLRFCARMLRNAHDAEEVVQDVFARLVEHQGRYDLARDPEVLLFRLARNRCIDVLRRRAPEPAATLDPAAPSLTDRLELDELLATLPASERSALLLTAIDGLGYREVAAILNCSLGSVAALRCRAINKLRRSLTP